MRANVMGMDAATALQVFVIAAALLGVLLSLIALYWVIRLAVVGALRSHYYWMQNRP